MEDYEKGTGVTTERFKRSAETVTQNMGVDTMIMFVRPNGGLALAKENLPRFRDEVISRL